MTDNTQTPERAALLPCPFCGGEALLENTITEASVMCGECQAEIWRKHTARSFDDGKHHAITAWNTRTTGGEALREAEQADLVEALSKERDATRILKLAGHAIAKNGDYKDQSYSGIHIEGGRALRVSVENYDPLASLQGRDADDGVAAELDRHMRGLEPRPSRDDAFLLPSRLCFAISAALASSPAPARPDLVEVGVIVPQWAKEEAVRLARESGASIRGADLAPFGPECGETPAIIHAFAKYIAAANGESADADDTGCPASITWGHYPREAEAIAAWNTRTTGGEALREALAKEIEAEADDVAERAPWGKILDPNVVAAAALHGVAERILAGDYEALAALSPAPQADLVEAREIIETLVYFYGSKEGVSATSPLMPPEDQHDLTIARAMRFLASLQGGEADDGVVETAVRRIAKGIDSGKIVSGITPVVGGQRYLVTPFADYQRDLLNRENRGCKPFVDHITKMQNVVRDYLPPDSGITEHEAMNHLIGLLDGPEQRALPAALRTQGQDELRGALREAGDWEIEGSVYVGMEAAISGGEPRRTIAHVPSYADALTILAALSPTDDSTQGQDKLREAMTAPAKAEFECGTYPDGSGPKVTVRYDTTTPADARAPIAAVKSGSKPAMATIGSRSITTLPMTSLRQSHDQPQQSAPLYPRVRSMIFQPGDTYQQADADHPTSGIDVDDWFNRIECYGKTEHDAMMLRNHVLDALAAFNPAEIKS